MTLTKEVLAAITAHNGHKPEPCFNEAWNAANKTGSRRARHLVMSALDFRYGICCGSMRTRKATKQDVADFILYRADADLNAWADATPKAAPAITNELDQFDAMIRSICPIGGKPDEYGIRLGNVEFWIDADGPWANQLSFSIPTSQWDTKRLSADLTRALRMTPAERKIEFEGSRV